MNKTVLRVENISKQYRLGLVGTGTLSQDLNRWWAKIRRKEDPYLKIGENNDRAKKGKSDYVWALKDINFELNQGEVLGIIGKNGAGKSTLLKLLSKVTGPTTGRILAKGRIASLLEVGTGFHPELTGRENIFLNGALLGMNRVEINAQLDEIIDFAGVSRYVDTPVKRYSSGMYVRLAFAVAAFLEQEILVVDEVLAVGDIEFQKKAIGKMQEVSNREGRTVLFVSHNLGSISDLCTKGLVMENGTVKFSGNVSQAINVYTRNLRNYKPVTILKEKGFIFITQISMKNANDDDTLKFLFGEPFTFKIEIKSNISISNVIIVICLNSLDGHRIFTCSSNEEGFTYNFRPKETKSLSANYNLNLIPGRYLCTFSIRDGSGLQYNTYYDLIQIEVINSSFLGTFPYNGSLGIIRPDVQWF